MFKHLVNLHYDGLLSERLGVEPQILSDVIQAILKKGRSGRKVSLYSRNTAKGNKPFSRYRQELTTRAGVASLEGQDISWWAAELTGLVAQS